MRSHSAWLLQYHRIRADRALFPVERVSDPIEYNLPDFDMAYEELIAHGFIARTEQSVTIRPGVSRQAFRITASGKRWADLALLTTVIDRPLMHGVARTGSALLAFLQGFSMAHDWLEIHLEDWTATMRRLGTALDPSLAVETVLTTGQILARVSGDDDDRAFDLLAEAIRNVIADMGFPNSISKRVSGVAE